MIDKEREPELGHPEPEPSRPLSLTYEHPPLTRDQAEYLRRIQSSSTSHDRNLLLGGPRNKRAS